MKNSIYRFIDDMLQDMKNTYVFSVSSMHAETSAFKKEWCLKEIENYSEQMYGAVLFCKCYEHTITDIEYDALLDRIYDARSEEMHRVLKEYN